MKISAKRDFLILAAVSAVAALLPLFTAYLPLVDYPGHLLVSAIAHGLQDERLGFQEQFTIAPAIALPYRSFFQISLLLMNFFSLETAGKAAIFLHIISLPIGTGLLCRALGKSPLLAIAAIPLMWGHLTHWGFINYMLACGLTSAMTAMLIFNLQKPSRWASLACCLCILGIFFSHVTRMPAALAILLLYPLFLHPFNLRVFNQLIPFVAGLLLFNAWCLLRLNWFNYSSVFEFSWPDFERLKLTEHFLFFTSNQPLDAYAGYLYLICIALLFSGWIFTLIKHRPNKQARSMHQPVLKHLLTFGVVLVSVILYLSEPFATKYDKWWYVFPREISFALLFFIPCLPDLSKNRSFYLAQLALLFLPAALYIANIFLLHASFSNSMQEFDGIVKTIDNRPSILASVYEDPLNPDKNINSFLALPYDFQLPSYIQAKKGGNLHMSMIALGASPVQYKKNRWPLSFTDWQAMIDSKKGENYSWVMLYHQNEPAMPSKSYVLKAHFKNWWIYHFEP